MLNIAYPLQNTVDINGKAYPVNLSFDNVLRVVDLLQDKGVDDVTRVLLSAHLFFIGNDTTDINVMYDDLVALLHVEDIGELYQIVSDLLSTLMQQKDDTIYDIDGNPMPSNYNVGGDDGIYFDMAQDSEYIYSSFIKDYGIDLYEQQGKMHYLKFIALLNGLSDDTKLKRVIHIRQMDIPKDKDGDNVRKLKALYRLDVKE